MRTIALTLLTLTLAAPRSASAQVGIAMTEVEAGGVRVDGQITDWRGAHFAELGSGPDVSMRYALGYDAERLYVAAQVLDDRVVRTPSPGANEDAVIVSLAMPSGRRFSLTEVWIFAGVAGRATGSAAIGSTSGSLRPLSGAQVVEGPNPRGRGYVVEAAIPWSAIPGASRWQRGRGSIRLRDVDAEARPEVQAEPALAPVDRAHLERLPSLAPTGGADGILGQFLAAQGLGAVTPSHDLRGDVAGDARDERVFVVDSFVVLTGPGYRNGTSYAFHRLPIDDPSQVRSAQLRDLTGDGKRELVVVLRQRNPQGERDLWQVIQLSGDSPQPMFAIELRKQVAAGSVESSVRVVRGRGRQPATIEVRAGRASGLDAASYRESPAEDAEPMLLPWGPIASRTYRWNGRELARVSERPNASYRPPAEEAPAAAVQVAEPAPPPSPPSEEELIAGFRRQRGIPVSTRPTFRARTNLFGARDPETVLAYGRHLVVVGANYRDGTSWFYYEIPAPSDADLLSVSATDVTGDQRGEMLFRVRQRVGDVERTILLIHQLTESGFPRLLATEVARAQGANSVENEVRTSGGRLEILPGRARGWTAQTWRFTENPADQGGGHGTPRTPAADQVTPLLLPWRDAAARYRFVGGRLSR